MAGVAAAAVLVLRWRPLLQLLAAALFCVAWTGGLVGVAAHKRSRDSYKPKPYVHKPVRYPQGADPETTQYVIIRNSPNPYIRDKARCLAHNRCFYKDLMCPRQCPKRKESKFQRTACFIDCSSKCQATCKHRKPNCYGYSSVCYDPRFVGGDGVMFYFHGKASEDFCLVTDPSLHINAHFIGLRPAGRTRDFTWVQALGILFEGHRLSIAARRTATWRDDVDVLEVMYDGEEVRVAEGAGATWSSAMDEVRVERVGDRNAVQVSIEGVMGVTVEAVPISAEEDRVHGYGLPADDCFAHLNIQFSFDRLSPSVDGVLGQTYQPGFQNPVKVGVPMPVMGGDTRFRTSSLFSTDCLASRFNNNNSDTPSFVSSLSSSTKPALGFNAKCSSTSTTGGILCRR